MVHFGQSDIEKKDILITPNTSSLKKILEDGKSIKTYGEYKIVLEAVYYLQCVKNDNSAEAHWLSQDPYPRVCENNFTVTTPYFIQKTPAGLTKTSKNLETFYMMNGIDHVDFLSKLKDVYVENMDSEYTSDEAARMFDTFISTYQKLAVKSSTVTVKGVNVKKVPSQNIYFVEDDDVVISGSVNVKDAAKDITISVKGTTTTITTPFTVVAQGNVTIKGNIHHNIMVLSQGNIIFDGTNNCDDVQTVRGIFYAKEWFSGENVQKNEDLDNNEWCIGGNLDVKGVLIWEGIDNLIESRRSHLNYWFNGENTNDEHKADIMSGAAVLVEYTPSLYQAGTTPPGANTFLQTLSVYKK